MVKATRIVVDAKTKKQKTEEFDFEPQPDLGEVKGIDLEKLKAVLLAKNIIKDASEIE